MAHVKATGTTKGNRDSRPKNLGIKVFAGQKVTAGSIVVRQRGTKFYPGLGTKIGGDDTIFAVKDGSVNFSLKKGDKLINVI